VVRLETRVALTGPDPEAPGEPADAPLA
jgi:hypothetical protein